jgi:Ribbon-helix-helix protein, copG family
LATALARRSRETAIGLGEPARQPLGIGGYSRPRAGRAALDRNVGAGIPNTVHYNVVVVAKSAPVSVRISKSLEALIDQEARRTGRSRSAVLEALASEALRMRLFPGVAFRGADWERRAWVIGTALDVWQIVEAYRDIGSVEPMAAGGAASERQIRLALAYYERFPDEIDAAIAGDRRPLDQLRDEHPFIAVSGAGA